MASPVLVILGQTAVGKSRVALEAAKELKGEIISADSMQVYRGMDIGTAKTPKTQRRKIPHHLIDICNPDESWTVADFVKETKALVPEIQKRKRVPIIVGGTGLYLWSLLEGFSFPPLQADKELRKSLEEKSSEELYQELVEVDPDSAYKIHPNNKKRIIRALEVFKLTGTPISRTQNTEHRALNTVLIGLTLPREKLYARINQRVDQMIEKGLVAEVEALLKKGYAKKLPAMEALGYKEILH
jgi:tRNA dimethylallyltransferase